MYALRRSSFWMAGFASLLLAIVLGILFTFSASAAGEKYTYIPSSDTIRVEGGVITKPAPLTRTSGTNTFTGGVTIKHPNINTADHTCEVDMEIDLNDNNEAKGVMEIIGPEMCVNAAGDRPLIGGNVAIGGVTGGKTNAGGTNQSDASPSLECEFISANPLNWIICPVINLMEITVNALNNAVDAMLTVDTAELFTPEFRTAWSSFRSVALALVVIAGLIIIVSQAIGAEILDAYTIRKLMPRLVLAVILITLSWDILKFLIDFTNVVGNSVRGMIYQPFSQMNSDIQLDNMGKGITLLVGGLIVKSGLIGLGSVGSLLLVAFLGVLIAFAVLLVRQLVIMMLVLLAPFAIACYILPNTEKVWGFWKGTLISMLVVFPIISGIIAAGRVFAVVAYNSGGPAGPSLLFQIMAFVSFFIPYFLIPFAFRLAGGAIATIGGIASDKSRGIFDRQRKYRGREFGQRSERLGRKTLQYRSDKVGALQTRASNNKYNPLTRGAFGLGARVLGGYNVEAQASARRASVQKELNDQIATGQDDEIRGLSVNKRAALDDAKNGMFVGEGGHSYSKNKLFRVNTNGQRQYKTLGGAWMSEAAVDAGHKRWGNDTFAQQASLSYEMRKANSEDQVQDLAKRYASVATGPGGWGQSSAQAGGTWIGSAFENQGQHLEYKGTTWQTGQLDAGGQKKFVDEVYEKKGSYPLAQMGSNTIEQLKKAHVEAVQRNDIDMQQKIKAISETFVHDMGGVGAVGGDDAELAARMAEQAGGGQVYARGRQASTPGAAHVAERVRELAGMTGVAGANGTPGGTAPSGYYADPNHAPSANRREQN